MFPLFRISCKHHYHWRQAFVIIFQEAFISHILQVIWIHKKYVSCCHSTFHSLVCFSGGYVRRIQCSSVSERFHFSGSKSVHYMEFEFFFHTQVSVNHLIHGFNDDKLFKYLCINLNGDELSVRVELSRAYVEWLKSITVHWM